MKNLKISLQEKHEILKKHVSLLNEQQTNPPANKTIMDIQKLVGVDDDNIVGPLTIQAIKNKIAELPKPVTPPKPAEISPELNKDTTKQEKVPEVKLGQGQGPENLSTVTDISGF